MSSNLFRAALANTSRVAVRDPLRNINFSYHDLLCNAQKIAQQMNMENYNKNTSSSSYPPRINLLVPPSFEYMASTFAIWSNNCISVPLCTSHPIHEMSYYVKDSESSLIIAHKSFDKIAKELSEKHNGLPYLIIEDVSNAETSNNNKDDIENYTDKVIHGLCNDLPSIFIYTSGTTSSPKGVVHSHNNLWSNIEMLTNEWHWNKNDNILNVLPMHHIHGLINISFCALANGASITFDKPNPVKIWQNFINYHYLNVFMAVPTIYGKLIQVFESMTNEQQIECREACKKFRLMVSGSAALPNIVMKQWHEISDHWLLERYGMTEILMCLSNPYNSFRKEGTVGFPMRNVETKIVQDDELYIKTDCMFKEYYNKPTKTKEEFTNDGWFKTGDCVEIDNDGYYIIKGRKKIDIIKYGGYKISALDIERALLEHPQIHQVAVLGIPDKIYGEIIGAIVVLKEGEKNNEFDLVSLRKWAQHKLAKYKIPELLLIMDDIPKNVMGKVAKKPLISLFDEKDNLHSKVQTLK